MFSKFSILNNSFKNRMLKPMEVTDTLLVFSIFEPQFFLLKINMLVGPRALEQLVSLERLTYVAYYVLVTCFLVFVQNKIFYLRCVFSN